MLMGRVTDIELLKVLHSFQKDAILGTGGFPVELFLGFIDMVGGDLLKVVEESTKVGHVHRPINSTFIALIPKKDKPENFDNFHPISLCNCL